MQMVFVHQPADSSYRNNARSCCDRVLILPQWQKHHGFIVLSPLALISSNTGSIKTQLGFCQLLWPVSMEWNQIHIGRGFFSPPLNRQILFRGNAGLWLSFFIFFCTIIYYTTIICSQSCQLNYHLVSETRASGHGSHSASVSPPFFWCASLPVPVPQGDKIASCENVGFETQPLGDGIRPS